MSIIADIAKGLLEDDRLMGDISSYSCIKLRVRLSQHTYMRSNEIQLLIEKRGVAFCKAVLADPCAVLGFEPCDCALKELEYDLIDGLADGDFVHIISGSRDELDIEKFIATRKAWLKFVINCEDNL